MPPPLPHRRSAHPAVAIPLALAALALNAVPGRTADAYRVKGHYVVGCEQHAVCPEIWSENAALGRCRSLMAWTISEGRFQGEKLAGLTFAAAFTQTDPHPERPTGPIHGILFLPEQASEAQRRAITGLLQREIGQALTALEVRTVPIELKGPPGHQELAVGTVARLRVASLRGRNGEVPAILHPPSPRALPINYCATAEVNSFDDGTTRWDFAGRSAFYGPFEMKRE